MEKKSESLLKIEREQLKVIAIIIDCLDNDLSELEQEMMSDLIQLHQQHWEQYLIEYKKPGDLSSCILPAVLYQTDNSEYFRAEAKIQVIEMYREKILCRLLELKNKEPHLTNAEIELHGQLLKKFNLLFKDLENLREIKYPNKRH